MKDFLLAIAALVFVMLLMAVMIPVTAALAKYLWNVLGA